MSTSINPRMRPRIAVSIGSIQLSKRRSSVSFCSNGESDFVVALVMAWSPVRRVNAGRFEVKHPGDYATFNSNHSRDATLRKILGHFHEVGKAHHAPTLLPAHGNHSGGKGKCKVADGGK